MKIKMPFFVSAFAIVAFMTSFFGVQDAPAAKDNSSICGAFEVLGFCTPKDPVNDQLRCAFSIGGQDIERIFMTIEAYDQLNMIFNQNHNPTVCANLENGKITSLSLKAGSSFELCAI